MRRNAIDIQYDIVVNTLEPIGQTRLMYACALNYTMLVQYLRRLVARGYVAYVTDSRIYATTVKGRRFIKNYEEYQRAQQALKKAYNALCADPDLLTDVRMPAVRSPSALMSGWRHSTIDVMRPLEADPTQNRARSVIATF